MTSAIIASNNLNISLLLNNLLSLLRNNNDISCSNFSLSCIILIIIIGICIFLLWELVSLFFDEW